MISHYIKRLSLGKLISSVLLLFLVLLWIIPTVGLFVSSFRGTGTKDDQIQQGEKFIIKGNFLDEGGKIIQTFSSSFRNLTEYNSGETAKFKDGSLFTLHANGEYQWVSNTPFKHKRGKRVFYVAKVPPTFSLENPGIWLAHTGFGLPLAIYLLRNYIGSLPGEIIESARMDGATHMQIFSRIVLPLSVPALASFCIFQFLWVWNDLLVALVFLGKKDDQIVLTSKLRELLGSRGDNWEILTSSAFISIIIPLIVFFALQRYFVRGLVTGSVKL